MHRVERERVDEAAAPRTDRGRAPRRLARILAIVLGGAFTGVLIGAPTGLIADTVGLPAGASAAVAALAFVMLALSVRWAGLRLARSTAEVTSLRDERDEERRAA